MNLIYFSEWHYVIGIFWIYRVRFEHIRDTRRDELQYTSYLYKKITKILCNTSIWGDNQLGSLIVVITHGYIEIFLEIGIFLSSEYTKFKKNLSDSGSIIESTCSLVNEIKDHQI